MELLTVSLSAFMVSFMADMFKRLTLTAWQVRGIVVLLSVVMGIGWYIFQTYLPATIQIEVQNFVAGTLAGAVFIYEFINKHIE